MRAVCDKFMDGIALGRKFLFILGHNISLAESQVMVEIEGVGFQVPAGFFYLFQRKFKQRPVVCLEMNFTFRS